MLYDERAITILGVAFLAAAILPRLLDRIPVTLPMVYVAVGMVLPLLCSGSWTVDPVRQGAATERLTELAVIISLMSAGLKLDRPVGWRSWRSTWGLLLVTMPLCILGLAYGGVHLIGLPLAAAILLGAVCAPTDPVLASDVQVGPPGEGREAEAPFALTSEAGLNDGLAFPFVNLAIVLAAAGADGGDLARWFAVDVVWRILAGLAVGAVIGYLAALLVFRFCSPSSVGDGFVAIALTFVSYGVTELAHGYGFIGVFVAAMVLRRYERSHEYHRALHSFSEQIERLLMAVLLLLFGASIAQGLFDALTWPAVGLALAFLLVVRPVAGLLGQFGTRTPRRQRLAIAALGIRGIGTFYYLSYGLVRADIPEPQARLIWAAAGFTVLVSIVLHGVASSLLLPRRDGGDGHAAA